MKASTYHTYHSGTVVLRDIRAVNPLSLVHFIGAGSLNRTLALVLNR